MHFLDYPLMEQTPHHSRIASTLSDRSTRRYQPGHNYVDKIGNVASLFGAIKTLLEKPGGTADSRTAPIFDKFIGKQVKVVYCRLRTSQVVKRSVEFHIRHQELFVQQSTVDSTIRIVVWTLLRQCVLPWHTTLRWQNIRRSAECMTRCGPNTFGIIWRMTTTVK